MSVERKQVESNVGKVPVISNRVRQRLIEKPTFIVSSEAGDISFFVRDREGGTCEAFARFAREESLLEVSAFGRSQEEAIENLGGIPWSEYAESRERMHRTGRVPRYLRRFKSDSF